MIHSKSNYLNIFLIVNVIILFTININAQNEKHELVIEHNNVLFFGSGFTFITGKKSQIAPILEFGYERRINTRWGAIFIFETEFEKSHNVYVLGLGPSYHFGKRSYIYAGPAIEFGDKSTKLTFNVMYKYKILEFNKSYIKIGSYFSLRRQLNVASIGLVANWSFPF